MSELNRIRHKLDFLNDFWTYYVLKTKDIQRLLRFNEDVKTNYYADILEYFKETLQSLAQAETTKIISQNRFFYTIGLLQIIYVQQDLIDELLVIYKIEQSNKIDKDPNRKIRNELIGHPISRDKKDNNKLVSSVFIGRVLSETKLTYVIYSKEGKFRGQEKNYEFSDIIKNHYAFVNKYLDLIIGKIKKKLVLYKKKLFEIELLIKRDSDFESIVKLTEQRYESFLKSDIIFSKEIILECYSRVDENRRYKFAFELFNRELSNSLRDKIKNIDNWLNSKYEIKPVKNKKNIKFEFELVNYENLKPSKRIDDLKLDYHYELGKLFEKDHPIYDISFFKKEFEGNKEILDELENMENNYEQDLEYYCSFVLIEELITNGNI